MKQGAKDAIRSGIVVVGALAFGYLTLQIGVKPFLLKAQQQQQEQQMLRDNSDTDFSAGSREEAIREETK